MNKDVFTQRERKSLNRESMSSLLGVLKGHNKDADILDISYKELASLDHAYDILSRISIMIKQVKDKQWPESELPGVVRAFSTVLDKVPVRPVGLCGAVDLVTSEGILPINSDVVRGASNYVKAASKCHSCLKSLGKVERVEDLYRIRLHTFRKNCRYAATLLL